MPAGEKYRPPEEAQHRFLFDEGTMTAAALEAFAEEGVSASAFIGQVARGKGMNHYRWAAHDELVPMTLEAEIPFVEVITKEYRMRFEVRAGTANLKRMEEVRRRTPVLMTTTTTWRKVLAMQLKFQKQISLLN